MLHTINNLFAATKAVLAEKEHLHEITPEDDEGVTTRQTIRQIETEPQYPTYSLGQIIHQQHKQISDLQYHNGLIYLTGANTITSLNATNFNIEWTFNTNNTITCFIINNQYLILGQIDGKIIIYNASDRTILHTLSYHNSKIVSLSLFNNIVHSTSESGIYQSFDVNHPQSILHSYSHSSSLLTCMAVENNDSIWLGSGDGQVLHLIPSTHSLNILIPEVHHQQPIRCLTLSPSPLPIQPKKPKKGKKKGDDLNEETNEVTVIEKDAPVIVWVSCGLGGIKGYDTRDGANRVILDYHHSSPECLTTLTSSLSVMKVLPAYLSSTSGLAGSPSSAAHSSLTSRSTQFAALPTTSSVPTMIHQMLYYQERLFTAHEERCIGVMDVKLDSNNVTKEDSTSYRGETVANSARQAFQWDQGMKLMLLNAQMYESVNHLVFVPANPILLSSEVQQTKTESLKSPVNGMDQGEISGSSTSSRAATATATSTPTASVDTVIISSNNTNPLLAFPYLLASTFSGDIHIFPFTAIEADLIEQQQQQQQRNQAAIECWLEEKNKTKNNKEKQLNNNNSNNKTSSTINTASITTTANGIGTVKSKGKKEESKEVDS